MKKYLPLILSLVYSGLCFSAPVSPQNGGTGVSNNYLLFVNRQISLDGSNSSALSINSPNQGSRPWPQLSHATGVTIPTPENGLVFWDTSQNTMDLWNGMEWQYLLTAQNVTGSGTITVTNNNGHIDIFGAGSDAPDAAYAAFSTQNNSSATTFPGMNSFKPVYLGALFSEDKSTDFSNSFMTIDSVSTPVMTYTGDTTQEFSVQEAFSIRGAIAVNTTFKFCIAIRRENGDVEVTSYCQLATINNIVDFIPGPKLGGNVTLATGDSVFAEVENITNGNGIYAAFSNYSANSVSGSIPDTNGLPQGTDNKYLTTNGGTTLASATGTINSGHFARFTGTSGLIQDAGYGDFSGDIGVNSTGEATIQNNAITTSKIQNGAVDLTTKVTGVLPNANLTPNTLTGSRVVTTDSSGKLATTSDSLSPIFRGLNVNNTGTPLSGVSSAFNFSSSIQYGNYINFGSFGPFLGIDTDNNGLWISGNLQMDAPSGGFYYVNTAGSGMVRVDKLGTRIQHAVSGSAATPATTVTDLQVDTSGNVNFPHATASTIAVFDSSKNLVSSTNPTVSGISITSPSNLSEILGSFGLVSSSSSSAVQKKQVLSLSGATAIADSANYSAGTTNTITSFLSTDLIVFSVRVGDSCGGVNEINFAFYNGNFVALNNQVIVNDRYIINVPYNTPASSITITRTTGCGGGQPTPLVISVNGSDIQAASSGGSGDYSIRGITKYSTVALKNSGSFGGIVAGGLGGTPYNLGGILDYKSENATNVIASTVPVNVGPLQSQAITSGLNIRGTSGVNASTNWYRSTDQYPVLQALPNAHNDAVLAFDAYRDASNWRSSSSNSSARIQKSTTDLRIQYGVASQGSLLSWNDALIVNTTNGNLSVPNGDLNMDVLGKTLGFKSGSNACTGTVALSGASTVISTTCAKTNDLLLLSIISPGGTPGIYSYTISNGTSATVTSTEGASDTSTLRYLFIHTN